MANIFDGHSNIENPISNFQVSDDTGSRFVLRNSFSFEDPDNVSDSVVLHRGLQADGIAFNPETGTIFVVRTDDPDEASGPEPLVQSVLQFKTDGTYINEFSIDTVAVPVGLTALPNGNLLIAAVNPVEGGVFDGKLVEVTTEGTFPADGINIDLPDAFNDRAQRGLVTGVTYADKGTEDTSDDSILVITSRSQEIVEFDLSGNELFSVDLSKHGIKVPQGLALDPNTGNIFVADEVSGTNKIYEIAPIREDFVVSGQPRFGELISVIDTSEQFGFDDPEGVSIGDNGLVYVVFDGDNTGSSGNQVVTFSLNDNIVIDPGQEQVWDIGKDYLFVESLFPDSTSDSKNDTTSTFSGNNFLNTTDGFSNNPISTMSGDNTIYASSNDKAFGSNGYDSFFVSGGDSMLGGGGVDVFWMTFLMFINFIKK